MEALESPRTSPTLLRLLRSATADDAVWERFVERYRPTIVKWCRWARLGPTDAEEVQSRVLTKLVSAMREFDYDPARTFRGWLFTVVKNVVCNYWREQAHCLGGRGSGDPQVAACLEQIPDESACDTLAEEIDEQFQADLRLAHAVVAKVESTVAPHVWQAYWLTAIEGQDPSEVAKKLGISRANVYVAKGRVAKKLREEAARWKSEVPPS